MRLQKYIAQCGVCSRRKAEELIVRGRVTVNGNAAALGDTVDESTDVIVLDGLVLTLPRERTYIMLHKPAGYVTTLSDPQGRPTVAQLTADAGVRLFPVGRLDVMTEGLLIMTDDGERANRLAHPSHGVKKTYRVWIRGEGAEEKVLRLTSPVSYDGVLYRGGEVQIICASGQRMQIDLTISEGKNREVRNMCAAVGLRIERLVRLRQGELNLGDLPPGKWRYLTKNELEWLDSLK